MEVRLPKREQERLKQQVKKAEEQQRKEAQKEKKCIICGQAATHQIKDRPHDTYCRSCAKEYFKLLSYLERL